MPSPARVLLLDESKEIHSSFMLQCLSLDVTSATRGVRIPAVLHPARTDVADVFAGAGDGNSATYGSAHRRGGGCDGGGGSEQGFISDHGRIAPTGESVNAAEILRRSSTNAASGAIVTEWN